MRVAQIWSYPVKSMVGATVERGHLDDLGLRGDRLWAVRDLDRGGICGAKKIGDLMRLEARLTDGGGAEMMWPDGRRMTTDDPAIDATLGAFLGRNVRLERLPSADDLDHFRRGAADSDDFMAELRSVFGREDDEPLPDLSQFPPVVMEFESPPGTHHDCWPLMFMSTSALRALAEALPDSTIDVKRFRPSFVIDTGEEPGHPEFAWTGRRFTVGEAEIEIVGPCPRCVMVTRAVGRDLPEDRAVLRHIVRDLDQNVGVYATVVRPGSFAAGDPFVAVE